MKLSFFGAAQEVTGSCFLLENGKDKILIDCGLFQCPKFCDIRSHDPFPFDPKSVSALFVTHAHVDHTGRIPKLVKEGFSGKIYSTNPTKDLAEIMLKDSVSVMAKEAERDNEKVPYTEEDVDRGMSVWEGKNYSPEIWATRLTRCLTALKKSRGRRFWCWNQLTATANMKMLKRKN